MLSTRTMPKIFSQFDQIRVINLASRPDRRKQMIQQIRALHLDEHPSIEFFDAISRSDPGPFLKVGSHGAFDSHFEVLRMAASQGHSVLILQDDCKFIRAVEDAVDISQVDIFYGGWQALDEGALENSDIVGAHCMGFSSNAAAKAAEYLSGYKRPEFSPDPRAAAAADYNPSVRPPIDGALVWFRRANPKLVVKFHKISEQRSSVSSISPKTFSLRALVKRVVGQI